jgi:hypothetical protein
MMVVRSKMAIAIYVMACTCALMLLFSPTLNVFWSYFALLQPRSHFDDGCTSKAILTMSSTCTQLLFMLLQSPRLVFLFINDEVFVISFQMSTHQGMSFNTYQA